MYCSKSVKYVWEKVERHQKNYLKILKVRKLKMWSYFLQLKNEITNSPLSKPELIMGSNAIWSEICTLTRYFKDFRYIWTNHKISRENQFKWEWKKFNVEFDEFFKIILIYFFYSLRIKLQRIHYQNRNQQ